MSASFVFFTALGYGATLLSPLMSSVRSWRIVDVITGLLMLGFAAIMLSQTSWLAGFVTS
jgi:L-lysine exporter family protein LysE/ArgO